MGGFLRGIGPLEIFLILVVVMIIFGVGKLPEIGSGMGKAIREFKSSVGGGEKEDEEEQKTDVEKSKSAS
ncbi:MAG: twin-arginine translocase TatA/TatE family subunit [Dehalococcoidia bacterium]